MKKLINKIISYLISALIIYFGFIKNIVFFQVVWFGLLLIVILFAVAYALLLFYTLGSKKFELLKLSTEKETLLTFDTMFGIIFNCIIFYIVYQSYPIIASICFISYLVLFYCYYLHRKVSKGLK